MIMRLKKQFKYIYMGLSIIFRFVNKIQLKNPAQTSQPAQEFAWGQPAQLFILGWISQPAQLSGFLSASPAQPLKICSQPALMAWAGLAG